MVITTPMTAAMELYNWLSEKLLKTEIKDGNNRMSPVLEKYFSALDVRKQNEILNSTLREVSEKVSSFEKKVSEEPRQIKMKEDRKKEIIQLYLK